MLASALSPGLHYRAGKAFSHAVSVGQHCPVNCSTIARRAGGMRVALLARFRNKGCNLNLIPEAERVESRTPGTAEYRSLEHGR
jgi:hypothetical protein